MNLLSRIKMGKKFCVAILKLKKIIFIAVRPPKCLKDVDIEKVLVSNKISFGEQNCNYFLVTCIMIIKFRHHK